MKFEHINKTNNYQLVGNCQKILFEGAEIDCIKQLEVSDPINMGLGVIQIFAPGQKEIFIPAENNIVVDATIDDLF